MRAGVPLTKPLQSMMPVFLESFIRGKLSRDSSPGAEQQPHSAEVGKVMRQGAVIVARCLFGGDAHRTLERDQDRVTENDRPEAANQQKDRGKLVGLRPERKIE